MDKYRVKQTHLSFSREKLTNTRLDEMLNQAVCYSWIWGQGTMTLKEGFYHFILIPINNNKSNQFSNKGKAKRNLKEQTNGKPPKVGM